MNAIIGFAELLEGSELPPEEREMVRAIEQSAGALLGLINEVLDFSRIEAGRLEIVHRPFDPRKLLSDVSRLFELQARKKGIDLRCSVGEASAAYILGDRERLRQVLVNLVGNALKFTERGTVAVRIHARNGRLVLEVEDTGPGIPEEVRNQLFAPFFQVDGSATRRHEGTGLGLAICQGLVNGMGGTLEVESEVGRGALFRANVPAPAAGPEESELRHVSVGSAAEPVASRRLKILVVEDHPVNQTVVSAMLRRLGHQADLAADGPSALEALGRDVYDLVLLDLHMPGMGGLEVARRIRDLGDGPTPPIIALTASVLAEDRERCMAVGMAGFLAKPLRLEELREHLSRLFGADKTVEM
jgi:CheY-like chemotaxis protein/anti-sigma regulatory factor (Ser/Thr protein kinase)